MGGSALFAQGKITKRLDKKEFLQIQDEVMLKLAGHFSHLATIPFYREKETFGDLDILIAKPKMDRDEFTKILQTQFKSEYQYFNQDVISFDYKDFQVDLIFVPESDFETALNYYSWNDINNLVGQVAKIFNLKHSHKGLVYIYRGDTDSGYFKREITVSKNLKDIYTFLGYDYSIYEDGFDTLNEMFDFVVSTPYIDTHNFEYSQLNAINRVRNRKRKNYVLFLEYLVDNNIKKSFHFSKDEIEKRIDDFFPEANFSKQIARYNNEYKTTLDISQKFNGELVMRLISGLHGRELGKFIYSFRLKYSNEEILNTNELQMCLLIIGHHSEFIRQNELDLLK